LTQEWVCLAPVKLPSPPKWSDASGSVGRANAVLVEAGIESSQPDGEEHEGREQDPGDDQHVLATSPMSG
jgi:hypothetical protein